MKTKQLTVPDIGLIAATRVMLGAGLGFLLSERLPHDQRWAVGWTLLLIGLGTTLPIAMNVFGQSRHSSPCP